MLLANGLAQGDAPERMNLERPEVVTDIHAQYVAAGADAVQTNTFGGNPIRLKPFGLDEHCAQINRTAVDLARRAAPSFVIGDIGPTGEYLPPVGTANLERWYEAFQRQVRALSEAGVDAFHVETMSDVREAEVALRAVLALAPGVPVLVSLTFDRWQRGFFTIMGDPLIDSLNRLAEAGATVVGANCTINSGVMQDLAAEALPRVRGRLAFQPNAGRPSVTREGVRYDQSPEEFAADLLPVIEGGAAAVGGCCGTDPRFIANLADEWRGG